MNAYTSASLVLETIRGSTYTTFSCLYRTGRTLVVSRLDQDVTAITITTQDDRGNDEDVILSGVDLARSTLSTFWNAGTSEIVSATMQLRRRVSLGYKKYGRIVKLKFTVGADTYTFNITSPPYFTRDARTGSVSNGVSIFNRLNTDARALRPTATHDSNTNQLVINFTGYSRMVLNYLRVLRVENQRQVGIDSQYIINSLSQRLTIGNFVLGTDHILIEYCYPNITGAVTKAREVVTPSIINTPEPTPPPPTPTPISLTAVISSINNGATDDKSAVSVNITGSYGSYTFTRMVVKSYDIGNQTNIDEETFNTIASNNKYPIDFAFGETKIVWVEITTSDGSITRSPNFRYSKTRPATLPDPVGGSGHILDEANILITDLTETTAKIEVVHPWFLTDLATKIRLQFILPSGLPDYVVLNGGQKSQLVINVSGLTTNQVYVCKIEYEVEGVYHEISRINFRTTIALPNQPTPAQTQAYQTDKFIKLNYLDSEVEFVNTLTAAEKFNLAKEQLSGRFNNPDATTYPDRNELFVQTRNFRYSNNSSFGVDTKTEIDDLLGTALANIPDIDADIEVY